MRGRLRLNSDYIILHDYPQSPVSEKVRVVFGVKGLNWKSVEIPRLPPKPNLMPLTGGYRLTPVMQIGADIFCDTKCIIHELDRRFPDPPLIPRGSTSLLWGLMQWTDGPLLQDILSISLVEMSNSISQEFLNDRGPLYFGSGFSLDELKEKYSDCLANVRTQFGWVNDGLKSSNFFLGGEPCLADALIYYLVWFLRDRMKEGDLFLQQFPYLVAWEKLVKALGHGSSESLSDTKALEIARISEVKTPEETDMSSPLGLLVGDSVVIEPDSGGQQVEGVLHRLSSDSISILRQDQKVGQVCVHFPILGYSVKVLK